MQTFNICTVLILSCFLPRSRGWFLSSVSNAVCLAQLLHDVPLHFLLPFTLSFPAAEARLTLVLSLANEPRPSPWSGLELCLEVTRGGHGVTEVDRQRRSWLESREPGPVFWRRSLNARLSRPPVWIMSPEFSLFSWNCLRQGLQDLLPRQASFR